MDKRLILAVAGSGKTSLIINSLSLNTKALVLTYTENNCNNIKERVINKFGHIPRNIVIQTYFTFLYSICYKPFLDYKFKANGINWNPPPPHTLKLNRNNRLFYIDKLDRLYSNRIAKLITDQALDDVKGRIRKYFNQLYIDEVQDFAGHDFNLLKCICDTNIDIVLVGDFYQHTFDTSRDGNVNVNLHCNYERYITHFSDINFMIDITSLSHTHRCSKSICNFITNNLGIKIESNKLTDNPITYITDNDEIDIIFNNNNIVKLFFKEHNRYPCYSNNWGKSKGLDNYTDVCVVLNKSMENAYNKNDFSQIPSSSINKFYVACTRANQNIYLISESNLKKFKLPS